MPLRYLAFPLAALAALSACGERDDRTEITVQRFFGACQAEYGDVIDPQEAEGECGIITAMINQFEAENPDIKVVENTVFWPGYDQLTSQIAANGPPDVVTMHSSAIPDYEARDLLEPLGEDLPALGLTADDFTAAARAGVTVDGEVMGIPIDVWAPLWHINLNLFREAGLVDSQGRPIMPRSTEEFLEHADRFVEATGKPYFIQVTTKDLAGPSRIFQVYMMQQGDPVFPDPRHADFDNARGREVLKFMRDVYAGGYSVRDQDYAANVSAFLRGMGGILVDGTWMVGQFDAAAHDPDSPLYQGYAVRPVPMMFDGPPVSLVDGHNWVMPRDSSRTPEERAAALRFLRFFAENDFQWARTGHFPAYRRIIDSAQWQGLPHRDDIAIITEIGQPLPNYVRRQAPIELIVGEEVSAAFTGAKPIDAALRDMERRTNDVLQSF